MYCVKLRQSCAGAALFLLSLSVAAPNSAGAEQVALQAEQGPAESGLQPRFANVLETRIAMAAAAAEDAGEKAWLAQLRSFYIARAGKPAWVSARGWNAQALAVMEEVSRAADWGLDPAALALPALALADLSDEELAAAELALSRAVVRYVHHARGGRIDPSSLSLWLGRTDDPVFATAVMIDVALAQDPAQALRNTHPPYEAFGLLREAYIGMRREIDNPKQIDTAEILASGKLIKVGEWHPDVLVVRRRLKAAAVAGYESRFDEDLANALDNYLDARNVKVRWGRIDDKVRAVFNRPPPPPDKDDLMRILANMERWRWLPRDLGKLHIWNNLPEFMTRVIKDGAVIHQERIIVGQPDTQTPVFSNVMRQVVFQPEWGVPPSIKINDLLPKLQSGDYDVLDRRNMRILGLSGKELNPERFNWDKVDIRDIGIYQRSGDGNPLGRVKFLFPNKHHVYMHDTNNRALFKHEDRVFSHGCVRVRDPEALAKLILAEDKGWDEEQVEKLLDDWKKPNNKIALDRPFPVHNVYFTLVPGEGRTLVRHADMYGHDKRLIQALSGVPAVKIAASDPARSQLRELDEAAPPMVKKALRQRAGNDDD